MFHCLGHYCSDMMCTSTTFFQSTSASDEVKSGTVLVRILNETAYSEGLLLS